MLLLDVFPAFSLQKGRLPKLVLDCAGPIPRFPYIEFTEARQEPLVLQGWSKKFRELGTRLGFKVGVQGSRLGCRIFGFVATYFPSRIGPCNLVKLHVYACDFSFSLQKAAI